MTHSAITVARPLPRSRGLPPIWRIALGWLAVAYEVMSEAREMERRAHQRHPFVSW
jgi:hypothetical protein